MATCGCGSGHPGTLDARIVAQPHDTVEFTAGARLRRCSGGRGFTVEGIDGGNGVFLWLRSTDSAATGEYPILARGDTVATRGVSAGVRFLVHDTDRGATLDSGAVTLSAVGGLLEAHLHASGLDPRAAQRVVVEASFTGVPRLVADTVSCRVQI